MRDLNGRTCLVTGASRGLGVWIARDLAAAGARVALAARSGPDLERVAGALRDEGHEAVALTADLAEPAARERLVAEVAAALGPVDVLVNNAGIESEGPFTGLDARTIRYTVELNVTAPMDLTRLVLPGMLRRRLGHVVNIASGAGKKAIPFDALYGGTKAAIVEWTNALRVELRGSGVSLSAVCPGFVTGDGMFARFGTPYPRAIGHTTPARVARAVVRAIRRDKAELIVNSLPLRPWLALYQLWPGVADRALHALGVVAAQRKKLAGR